MNKLNINNNISTIMTKDYLIEEISKEFTIKRISNTLKSTKSDFTYIDILLDNSSQISVNTIRSKIQNILDTNPNHNFKYDLTINKLEDEVKVIIWLSYNNQTK